MGGRSAVKNRKRIQELIQVEMITDGEHTRGWVHTHGMHALGLPELEVRNVEPLYMMVDAARLLNHVAQFLFDSRSRVQLGHTLQFDRHPSQVVRFQRLPPIPGEPEHFQVERWALVGEDTACTCEECARSGSGKGAPMNQPRASRLQ